jgi:RNA polymerase sigma-70 factor (ECF subfamily)
MQEDVKKIIKRAIAGDEKSAGELYTIYIDPLYRYVFSRVRSKNDSEDIVQDVFLKLYKNLKNISFDA